ncbi:MAG: hypothetical protein HQK51_02310 [Oligoflexia bacterium]|nr:hypothetical protein [Oligoflexia bacterium]
MCKNFFNAITGLSLTFIFTLFFTLAFTIITPSSSINFFAVRSAYALPMDWQGILAADTTSIGNFRRTNTPYQINPDRGSQQIPVANGDSTDASFQSYILRLAPSIVINDSASFFGEITTGYNRGGFFGDGSAYKKGAAGSNSFGDALYLQNTYSGNSNVALSQFNVKLYTDSATYIIGRQSFHWGLGAIMNSGEKTWDRYATIQDGVTAKLKVGNFNFIPYYAKINSIRELTKIDDTKSYGIGLLYDSVERDMAFGILYGKRSSRDFNTFFQSSEGYNLGNAFISIVDLHFKKTLNKFSFAVEAPIISGDLGNVYSIEPNSSTSYKAYAVVAESSYKFNESWSMGAMAGYVTGEDGEGPYYAAMYLNPNYKIANLLFNYNLQAVTGDTNQSIYDSYVVNTRYLKLHGAYTNGTWTYSAGLINARANEVAKSGGGFAFNHTTNKRFNSNYSQEKNLGNEIDLGVNYQWNSNVSLRANLGYLFVGDYYKYTNTEAALETKNCYSFVFGIATSF